MKIKAQVELVNRWLDPDGVGKGRPQRSTLAICKTPAPDNELHIIHQTLGNSAGTKFKVRKNVTHVFMRFLNEGKATIRFHTPPTDMLIKSDVVQLKGFMQVLKLALNPKIPVQKLQLTSIATTSPPEVLKDKSKMQILSRKCYPHTEGFPRILESLKISGIEQTVFDTRILKLQNLKKLDLSDNLLTSLPEALGNLPCLSELHLQHNKLGEKNPNDIAWNWLNGRRLMANLQYLDLSHNQMSILPGQITRLVSLITLKLDYNNLQRVPQGLGNMLLLRYLSISHNKLRFLPGSMKRQLLFHLDLSFNCFGDFAPQKPIPGNVEMPNLLERAGRVILNRRLHYTAELIPYTLVNYLDNALYCVCGKPCFETYTRKFVAIELRVISTDTILDGRNFRVWFDTVFCSHKCVLSLLMYM